MKHLVKFWHEQTRLEKYDLKPNISKKSSASV